LRSSSLKYLKYFELRKPKWSLMNPAGDLAIQAIGK